MNGTDDPMKQQRELTAGLLGYTFSHILNNKLSPAVGFAELIADSRSKANAEQKKYAKMIVSLAQSARPLIAGGLHGYYAPKGKEAAGLGDEPLIEQIAHFVEHGSLPNDPEGRSGFSEMGREERRLVAGAAIHSLKVVLQPALEQIRELTGKLEATELSERNSSLVSKIKESLPAAEKIARLTFDLGYSPPEGYSKLARNPRVHAAAIRQTVEQGIIHPRVLKPGGRKLV